MIASILVSLIIAVALVYCLNRQVEKRQAIEPDEVSKIHGIDGKESKWRNTQTKG